MGVLAHHPQPRIVQIPTRGNLLNALLSTKLYKESALNTTNLIKRHLTTQELAYYLRFNKKCNMHTPLLKIKFSLNPWDCTYPLTTELGNVPHRIATFQVRDHVPVFFTFLLCGLDASNLAT